MGHSLWRRGLSVYRCVGLPALLDWLGSTAASRGVKTGPLCPRGPMKSGSFQYSNCMFNRYASSSCSVLINSKLLLSFDNQHWCCISSVVGVRTGMPDSQQVVPPSPDQPSFHCSGVAKRRQIFAGSPACLSRLQGSSLRSYSSKSRDFLVLSAEGRPLACK